MWLRAIKNFKALKLPTYFFIIYILLVPFESILARPIFGTVASYATFAATLTGISVGFYLLLKPNLVRLTKTAIPWIAFFLWAGISIIYSFDKPHSIFQYIFHVKHLFFYLFICSYPFNSTEKRTLRHAIILSASVLSLYVLFDTYYLGGISNTVRATIKNGYYQADPNHLAASLILPLSLIITEFLETKKSKIFDFISAVLIFVTILVTGSRGAFLAVGLTSVTLAILYFRTLAKGKLMLAILLIFIATGLTASYTRPDLLDRYTEVENLDRYSANRTIIWESAFKHWRDQPFEGFGFGTFSISNIEYVDRIKTAHNIYIQALYEGGIVGLIILASATMSILTFKTYDRFSRAAKAAAIGVFTASFFLYTMNYDYFWITMMLAEISTRTIRKPNNKDLLPKSELAS